MPATANIANIAHAHSKKLGGCYEKPIAAPAWPHYGTRPTLTNLCVLHAVREREDSTVRESGPGKKRTLIRVHTVRESGPGRQKENTLHRPGIAPPGKKRTRIRVYTVRESSPGSTRKNAEPGLVGMIVGVCRGRVVEGEVGAAAGWWA